jgi:hypothetical protein
LALCIAKAKKPFTITEELIIPCMKDICFELLCESASNKINCVPLSNNTIPRRVDELAEDMEEQLLQQIKTSSYYSLQIDESTDVTNMVYM